MFGLQFYGECWGGPGACQSHSKHGESNHCVGQNFTPCDLDADSECVGEGNSNFVYLLLDGNLCCADECLTLVLLSLKHF